MSLSQLWVYDNIYRTQPPHSGSSHQVWYSWLCATKTDIAANARVFAHGGRNLSKLMYRRLHARIIHSQQVWRRRALFVQNMPDADVRLALGREPPVRDASSDLVMAQRALSRVGQEFSHDMTCIEARALAIFDLGRTHMS
jgi:hypothetical protein